MYDQEKAGIVALLLGIPTHKVSESLGEEIAPCTAKTISEARNIYKSLLCVKQRSAYLLWDKLSLEAGEKNDNIWELNDIWKDAPNRGKAKKYISKKIQNICSEKLPNSSYLEAKEIYIGLEKDGKIVKLAVDQEEIAELAVAQMVFMANNHEQALESYQAAESLQNYDLELAAIKKIYDFTVNKRLKIKKSKS